MNSPPFKIGAVLYPGFEMLDMFGPLEMFSMLGTDIVEIKMIAQNMDSVTAAIRVALDAGPRVEPDHDFSSCPPLDIVLVPGGFGTRIELENSALLNFLREKSERADIVASVCTGSALLAKAGCLEGKRATSNKQFFSLATQQSNNVQWIEKARWVEDEKFFTSSGVSAGIDMTLAIITRLFGIETAEKIAKATEYNWHRDADVDPFTADLNEASRAVGLI
ncbi:MAG: DJ-1/PfpI family protein [Halioglobus sp.]|nr:DJ-1/PfpI family protein [Halioglobus sp.]